MERAEPGVGYAASGSSALSRDGTARLGVAGRRKGDCGQGGADRCTDGLRARRAVRNAPAIPGTKLPDLQAVLQRPAALRVTSGAGLWPARTGPEAGATHPFVRICATRSCVWATYRSISVCSGISSATPILQ